MTKVKIVTDSSVTIEPEVVKELDAAYELYKELAAELKDNPEFLEQFIYLLRELGKLEEAKDYIQSYLQLVPDDLQMQDLYDDLF